MNVYSGALTCSPRIRVWFRGSWILLAGNLADLLGVGPENATVVWQAFGTLWWVFCKPRDPSAEAQIAKVRECQKYRQNISKNAPPNRIFSDNLLDRFKVINIQKSCKKLPSTMKAWYNGKSRFTRMQFTTLQSMINAKLGQHRFWPSHKNGLTRTIPMIPHNL